MLCKIRDIGYFATAASWQMLDFWIFQNFLIKRENSDNKNAKL